MNSNTTPSNNSNEFSLWQQEEEYNKQLQEQKENREKHHFETIIRRIEQSGEKEILRQQLKEMLKNAGWVRQVKSRIKEIVKTQGLSNTTVENLLEQITPFAREQMPDDIKKQLYHQITSMVNKYDQ